MNACSQNWNKNLKLHLHFAIDNCTGNVVRGYFDHEETLLVYYYVFEQILLKHEAPCKFKTNKKTIYIWIKKSKIQWKNTLNQFWYTCKVLGAKLETTSVAQAKWQIERLNGTFQDR